MRLVLLTLLMALFIASPVQAFMLEEGGEEVTKTIEDYIEDFVDVPEGGVNWKVFGTTKEIEAQTIGPEGYDYIYSKPDFAPQVVEMDGKEIKIKGYMFPLESEEAQKKFLLGPFPASCPFRYHVGPPLVIEVHAENNPVNFDYEPVTIQGTLELVHDDPEFSTFYRLHEAAKVD